MWQTLSERNLSSIHDNCCQFPKQVQMNMKDVLFLKLTKYSMY